MVHPVSKRGATVSYCKGPPYTIHDAILQETSPNDRILLWYQSPIDPCPWTLAERLISSSIIIIISPFSMDHDLLS